MKANYEERTKPAYYKAMAFRSKQEERAWALTEERRLQEYEAYADAVEITLLYTLMVEDKRGAKYLRRIWEAMIRNRVEARKLLREQEGEYELVATNKNVEDFYFREELRKKGVDVQAWVRGLKINFEEGTVEFCDGEDLRRKEDEGK